MITLDAANVRLGEAPQTKEEAIRLVASLLADGGHIDAGYADSMLGREQVANTYLGEGIAIPHGLLKDRDLIRRTGIAVVQVPEGVEWNPGERVRLVVGIAAASDEHLQILANLTQVLADADEVERLATTTDPALVVDRLTRGPGDTVARTGGTMEFEALEDYARAEVVIQGASGLHARPATFFVDVAKGFDADVRVRHDGKVANGKSLASLLSLGAEAGAPLIVLAKGTDQDAALEALREAVDAGLGEDEDDEPAVAAELAGPAFEPAGSATAVPGIAASPGIAIGPLWHLKRRRLVVERTAKDPAAEERRLRRAIEVGPRRAARSARRRQGEVGRREGRRSSGPTRRSSTTRTSRPRRSARSAPGRRRAGRGAQRSSGGPESSQGSTTRCWPRGRPTSATSASGSCASSRRATTRSRRCPDHPVILIADDLTPSDTAAIDPARVVGFCTALGGPTSHTAIIARALGIPALVGAGPAVLGLPQDAPAVLDGSAGHALARASATPTSPARHGAQRDLAGDPRRGAPHALRAGDHDRRPPRRGGRPTSTAPEEAAAAVEAGAEGVGLMRTEFLFLGRDAPPTEEEQYEALAAMVRALNGLPLDRAHARHRRRQERPLPRSPRGGQLVPRRARHPSVPRASRAVPPRSCARSTAPRSSGPSR